MADVRRPEDRGREPPDGDDVAPAGQLDEERQRGGDLLLPGPAVRPVRAGMGRDDVPEQYIVFEPELGEDAVDDRRGRLGGPRPGQLPLRGEGNAAPPGAAVAGRFSDEDRRGVRPSREVGTQPRPAQLGAGVLVVRRTDPRRGEAVYEVQGYEISSSSEPSGSRK